MIEMALVLPVFMMLILGVIEFGQAIMVKHLITTAARDGARAAVFDGATDASVKAAVIDILSGTLGVEDRDVTVTITVKAAPDYTEKRDGLAEATRRDLVSVRVEVPFAKLSYMTPTYLTSTNLGAEVAMRHE